MISFGRSARASDSSSLVIEQAVLAARTPYCTARNHLPDMFGAAPCERWPPAASAHAEHGIAGLQQRQEHCTG